MQHKMYILNQMGHTEVEYDTEVADDVDKAKEHFDAMTKAHRYSAFAVSNPGTNKEEAIHISKFDPNASEIVFVPNIVGGK